MASVTFTDVEKRYGDVSVIDRLNLEVRDREYMVLVGPSGSGKSTALRMIAGLEEISGGTIAIDGRPVNDVAPRDRNICLPPGWDRARMLRPWRGASWEIEIERGPAATAEVDGVRLSDSIIPVPKQPAATASVRRSREIW